MEDLENQMDLYQRNNLNEFVKKDFILKFKAERIEQMEKENERIKERLDSDLYDLLKDYNSLCLEQRQELKVKIYKKKDKIYIQEENLAKRNLFILPIQFENEKRFHNFLVDSGAQLSCIKRHLYKELKLKKKEVDKISINGACGGTENSSVYNFDFKIYNDKNIEMPVFNADMSVNILDSFSVAGETLGISLEGLLGIDFLQKYGFNIDFEKKVLSCKCS